MNYPIKRILKKPDLAGRMVSWTVEMSECDITYTPRNSIKSQVLAIFLIELSSPIPKEIPKQWILSLDGSYNLKGSREGIVLEGSRELIIEQSFCFNFQANNNQAEYEAVIVDLKLAREVRVSHMLVRTGSQLVTSQIRGDYQTNDALLLKYLCRTLQLAKGVLKI